MTYRDNRFAKGFALLEVLLLLVVIVIICGTGYYIWHSRKLTDTPATKTKTTPSAAVAPGKLSYSNTDYNFTFTYPADWGKASLYPHDINPPVKGHSDSIGFEGWSKMGAFVASRDWQPAEASADPVFTLTTYDDCVVRDTNTETFLSLYRAPDACVGVRVAMVQDDTDQDVRAAFLYAEKRLSDSPSNVLVFYGQTQQIDDDSEAALISYAHKGPFAEQLIGVVKSIKKP